MIFLVLDVCLGTLKMGNSSTLALLLFYLKIEWYGSYNVESNEVDG